MRLWHQRRCASPVGPTLHASYVHISVMAIASMCTWLQELTLQVVSSMAAATYVTTQRAAEQSEQASIRLASSLAASGYAVSQCAARSAEQASVQRSSVNANAFLDTLQREVEHAGQQAAFAMGAFVQSEERLAALVESATNSASSHVRLTELLALEARRNVVAEARLQVAKDRARAEVTMAHAELAIAMQRLGSQDHELKIALGRLADFSSSMSHELCAIALAQSAGKLSAFETELLKQLGKSDVHQGFNKEIVAVLGLVATGSAMDGARLLHARAPRLFPSSSVLRRDISKEWSTPVLIRSNLGGLPGSTLQAALKAGAAHFLHENYDGPLVAAHDSTAIKPVADVRTFIDADGQKWLEVHCFMSGPQRFPMTAEGAQEIAQAIRGGGLKASLGTLMLLVPACAVDVQPFSLFLVAGGGPNAAETEAWEQTIVEEALRVGLIVWLQGADGCVGPRGLWLRRHVVMHDQHMGGNAGRYRQTVGCELEDGEQQVVINCCGLVSLVATLRWVTFEAANGDQTRRVVWQLLGPDDPHGNKKGRNQLDALQRCLVLGGYAAVMADLEPLAAKDTYTALHRNDCRLPNKQCEKTANRVLHADNASVLRDLDQADARYAGGLGRVREGTAAYIEACDSIRRATTSEYVDLRERVKAATYALLFHLYWHAFISLTPGYNFNENFVSDGHYHDLLLRC